MKQQQALQMAREYKRLLEAARIPFTAVIVFGSVARNEMHDQSDIDVAVVGQPFKDDRFKEMHFIRKLRRPLGYKIQPIWFYQRHLDDQYSTLAQEIKKDGIPI